VKNSLSAKLDKFKKDNRKKKINKILNEKRKIIMDTSTSDFKNLILKNEFIFDKSLFIKEVIDSAASVLLITMPRRWGKSLNLDMLRRFLTNMDDNGKFIKNQKESDNYKLFTGGIFKTIKNFTEIDKIIEPCKLIKECKKAAHFLGKTPVIFISFNGFRLKTYKEVLEQFYKILEQTVSPFMGKKEAVKFVKDNKFNSIKSLCECLKNKYSKKPWILIDEYDAPLNSAYMENIDEKERSEIIGLFSNFYEVTFKNSGCQLYEKAVVTGILQIAQSGIGSGFNNADKYTMLSEKFSEFYGLCEEETDKHIGEFKDEFKYWYNGYNIFSNDIIMPKYNVYSTVKYLSNRKFNSYWQASASGAMLSRLICNSEIKDKLELLTQYSEGRPAAIIVDLIEEFNNSHFEIIRTIAEQGKAVINVNMPVILSYLYFTGYLTFNEKKEIITPNNEIRVTFECLLQEYYKQLFRFDPSKILDLTKIINSIFNSKGNIKDIFSVSFKNKFQDILNTIKLTKNKNSQKKVYANEDVIHSLLNSICLQVFNANFATEIYTKKFKSKKQGRADIMLNSEDTGMIIEVKYHWDKKSEIKDALEQAKCYKSLIKDFNKKVYIALEVNNEHQVAIIGEVYENNEMTEEF